jgi:hypothetical protein
VLKISISEQNLEFGGKVYLISSASAGIGSVKDSGCTPVGNFVIADKIGVNQPIRTIFESRLPVGVWDSAETDNDLILSRILTLDGCDNSNKNTLERYIYIHGTNQESMLGTPASCGCIRMSNFDIIELFESVKIGDKVLIKETNV